MKRMIRITVSIMVLAVTALLAIPLLTRWVEKLSPMPDNLGVQNGQLAPCPDTPNCVSTYENDEEHGIEKIAFEGTAEEAQARILTAIGQMERTTVMTNESGYIHVELRSPTMNFIDDAEFYFGEGVDGIQFRSAARLGYDDMNMNRKNMEKFRRLFAALGD